jgi:Mn-containing catalase
MLLDIGTEEVAHVEMLATMIARLLERAPVAAQEEAVRDPAVMAVMGGMNPQHLIVTGLGPSVSDSVGVPWNGRYVTASGNLLCDFRYNLAAESMGRLQVCRLYEQTEDAGVRDLLSFLIARDTMHQNQWIAAIQELQADGLEETPAPNSFPQGLELSSVAYQFWNCSTGTESREGSWADGPSPDGKGTFEYVETPAPLGPEPELDIVDPRAWGTSLEPVMVSERRAR